MLSRRAADSLRDMLGAIDLIEEWVRDEGGVENAVNGGKLIRSAIERQLLIN
jgi:hypothetical protein